VETHSHRLDGCFLFLLQPVLDYKITIPNRGYEALDGGIDIRHTITVLNETGNTETDSRIVEKNYLMVKRRI
jgi:hypothetical protein